MAKLKVDQFVDLVKRSGLVDNERLNEALSGIDQSINDSGVIAGILTKKGLLTEWHSEKLLQGRHKGFYLGKYKLLNHLGTGGMGSVYLAEHQVMRHQVAIKLLPNHLASQASYLERFHQEARALVRVNHQNIVKAYDVDQEGTNHYLVMEYVNGTDLQAMVSRSGPLPYRLAAEYTRQAAEGLACAHQSGLIHRDIKPANLLIDELGIVKILDMGLARFADESQASLTREYDQKMIGTVDYLAPEQAVDSHRVDARADIYSLGCTLYFMLTGDAPFPQGTIPQRLIQHQSGEPADIRNTRPDAPSGLIAICRKMMAKSPLDRYQSGTEVAEALADWLANSAMRSEASGAGYAPTGPSPNEDLTLVPLEDEPQDRAGAKASKPGDSKVSGASGPGTKRKPGSSGIKKSEGSPVNNGEPAAARPPTKPKSGVKPPPAKLPHISKAHDPMDDLLSAPALPPSEPMQAPAPPIILHKQSNHKAVKSMALAVGLGLLGAALIVGTILLLVWFL